MQKLTPHELKERKSTFVWQRPSLCPDNGSFSLFEYITRLIKYRNFGYQPMVGKILKPTSSGITSP
jgi:hypothetical protein